MKKRIPAALITFLTTAAIVNAQTDNTTLNKVGDKAPLFTCTTIDGKTVDISKLQGKVVMINFFATWCGPCNLELPVLQKNIWEKYRNRDDFALIILGREHSAEEVDKFVKSRNLKMPFAPDPERKIFSLYATQNIPRNVVIGKDGRIIFQGIGYSAEEFGEIEKVIAENLK